MLVEVDGKALRAAPGAGSERIESSPRPGSAWRKRIGWRSSLSRPVAPEGPSSAVPCPSRSSTAARHHPPRGRAHRGRGPRHLGRGRVPADIVQPPLEAALAPGLRVAIQRARPVTIGGPDVHLETRSRAESVGALLAEQGVPLGELDLVEPGLEAPVPAYGSVRVVRVREETEQVLIPLPLRHPAAGPDRPDAGGQGACRRGRRG